MTIKELASYIAKLEGKKSQAQIGDIRELLGILSDLYYRSSKVIMCVDSNDYEFTSELGTILYRNGKRRALRKQNRV